MTHRTSAILHMAGGLASGWAIGEVTSRLVLVGENGAAVAIILGFIAAMLIWLVRTSIVLRFRAELTADVFRLIHLDMLTGQTTDLSVWRLDALNAVSYNRMVFQFWRPVKSFYKDYSFIQLTRTP